MATTNVGLRHADKLLYPQDAITKGDVLSYYLSVAGPLFQHLNGRPLTLVRYPDGIVGKSFFQKNPPSGAPAWLATWPIKGTRYVLLRDLHTLSYLVGQGALELHTSPVRYPNAEQPDAALVDLDPMPPFGFADAVRVAILTLAALDALGLQARIKTSGATGVHLHVPIRPGPSSHDLVLAMKGLGHELRRAAPDLITLERSIARRHGVYFDYGQNAAGHTLAAAYSLRARPGAPVSCPLCREELPAVRPQDFTLRTVPRRIALSGDPWAVQLESQDPSQLLRLAALGRS